MKIKTNRLEAVKMILSSQEIGSQSDLLKALEDEGFQLTQATLSRDLKQLKVAKAASMNGKYVYVLPNETMYRRVKTPRRASEMQLVSGFLSINSSGIAYNIDSNNVETIIGTIAGDDTIFIVIREGTEYEDVIDELSYIIPDISVGDK